MFSRAFLRNVLLSAIILFSLQIGQMAIAPGVMAQSAELMKHYRQFQSLEKVGKYREAIIYARKVLDLAEKEFGVEHEKYAAFLSRLVKLNVSLGRYSEAETLYRKFLNNMEKRLGTDHSDVAAVLNDLAMLYERFGRYSEAETFYKRSLRIYKKSLGAEHPFVATIQNNLVNLYRIEGRYAEAELLFRRSLTIREKALGPDHLDVANSLNNIAGLYQMLGRYAEAELLFQRSLAIRQKILGPDHSEVANSLNNLALLYERQGRYVEAEPLYIRSLKIREKMLGPAHPVVAASLNNLAGLYFGQKDWRRAAEYWRRADAILTRRAALGQGGRTKKASEISQYNFFFSSLVMAIYHLNRQPGHMGETWQSAQWAQQSQAARALAQMAARQGADSGELAVLVRKRQDSSNQWQAVEKRMNKLRGAGKSDKRLEKRMAGLDKQLNEIDARLQKEFPEFFALTRPKPLPVKDTQKYLKAQEALIQFLFTEKEGFAWLVTKSGAKWVRLDVTEVELEKMVVTLRKGLDKDGGKKRAAGASLGAKRHRGQGLQFDLNVAHKLYKTLFGQFEAELKDIKHLMVVPSGPLQSLPPTVLVTQKPTHQYGTYDELAKTPWLIKKLALTVLPSVSSLRALRVFAKKSGKNRQPFIGIGDPILKGHPSNQKGILSANASLDKTEPNKDEAPVKLKQLYTSNGLANVTNVRGLASLPDTADELQRIATSLHASKDALYMRERASETLIKKIPLDKAKVIAFSTHGLVAGDLTGLAEPALVLTPPNKASTENDGLLMASEVAQLKLDADWVLLSACNTASSDGTPGAEGLSGLARAFFYAGARSLLVSHWPVYSDAAVSLTTGAFKAQEDDPKIGRSEALRRSILTFMQSGGTNAHPERWAPFVIVGEGAARTQ